GSNEPQFYALILQNLGLDPADLPAQTDRDHWPSMCERFAAIFKTKTRAQWTEILEQQDVCFAPVLRMSEAMEHHHNVERGSFVAVDGVRQPGPAPKFLGTPSGIARGCAYAGEHTDEALQEWGFSAEEVSTLANSGAVRQK
ncbi:MAG: CoA transferase, partial [Chromatiales bacterium]|nr:CoA transferase [Chromatiales bacterium]